MKGIPYTDGSSDEFDPHDAPKLVGRSRRPPSNQTRTHIPDSTPSTPSSSSPMEFSPPSPTSDELTRLRTLLCPPPIPGQVDWGIPPPPSAAPDPEITSKLAQFALLKHDTANPKHFNDSLMSNRSFRNPHLYATLVDWAGLVDEKATNFPKTVWDPYDLREEWFVENITEAQRKRADKIAAAQGPKRSHIDFTNPKRPQTAGGSASGGVKSARTKPTRWGQ